jgi:hypothetical protein
VSQEEVDSDYLFVDAKGKFQNRLARLWCAFRTTDAVFSGHLSAPTPQGGRQWTAACCIRGLRCMVVFGSAVTLAMLGYGRRRISSEQSE